MPSNRKNTKTRDYDAESGKNRVKSRKQRAPPPPSESESESEVTASESEIEEEFEIKAKDVHRRKPAPARRRKTTAQTDTKNEKPGDEPTTSEETATAPGDDFLVAIAYRQGSSAVQFDARSFFIPDCHNLFTMVFYICELLVPNSLVHEFDPSFMSITFYLYVAHLFYFQILRVRDSVGELTREERRCLRHYENVGQAESWMVPTPLIGLIRALASVQPPSQFYGKIIPKLPSFDRFTANRSLHGIDNVAGILRVPIIPAMQQFLHNFGTHVADFVEGELLPIGDATLTPGAAGPPAVPANRFVGLEDSAANGHAQYLFLNPAWNTPLEPDEPMANYPFDLKRALIHRYNVPNIGDTATITGIESFLGFRDGRSNAWMRHLLRSASTVARFFPGSVNLSAIGTVTQEEIIAPVTYNAPAQRNGQDHDWYRGRNLWTYSINGKVNTEQSGYLNKVAASAAPHFVNGANLLPAGMIGMASPAAEGPYFVNAAVTTSIPITLLEIVGQPDPTRNALALMDEKLYDNLAGRARN